MPSVSPGFMILVLFVALVAEALLAPSGAWMAGMMSATGLLWLVAIVVLTRPDDWS